MPPFKIDPVELWEAIRRLANEQDQSWRYTKKGDKRPAYDVEAQKKSRAATLARQREARVARLDAKSRERAALKKPKVGEDIASRMLRVMEPGAWYGMGDVMRLAGAARHERGKLHQVLVKRGWVEKVQNPAWSGSIPSPWEIEAGAEPHPQHLYRLTGDGLARKQALGHVVSVYQSQEGDC